MSVVIVSERVGRSGRHFTPEEDATIVAMRAAGVRAADIADALGRTPGSIESRVTLLLQAGAPKAKRGPRPKPRTVGPGHCGRCGILLAHAPAGQGGVCGYCAMEVSWRPRVANEREDRN